MLSRTHLSPVARPAYPAYRPFRVTVRRLLPLSPHLVRVTVTGPDLAVFGTTGLDQRVKLMFPLRGRLCEIGADDETTIREGAWYARWRALPDDERCPLRTYTVRQVRPDVGELDVDMVRHADGGGPAASWLAAARVGDELVVVGPDARSAEVTGIDWRPGHAQHLLLAGDETAAPAICSIVESLDGPTAQAIIEVPSADDILSVYPRGRSRITWLARDGGCTTAEGVRDVAPHGLLLTQTVRTWLTRHTTLLAGALGTPTEPDDVDIDAELLWESPPDPAGGDFYAWIAGEAAMVRDLRRLLRGAIGPGNAAFLGYWRAGRAEPQ
ncbi:siderophore-interacting protein [Actinotalea sp. M2MS4P-6]|uniref:siderophore-interacting protein n=1 Tax=Actinotalea sp. M2MS4P-6 TaxID=2983762 RepID=UPI0021E4DB8F|nr:siderophore-interacting protein [Actinotalea sp. M2MS4P-6]MCV2393611.1 siderophore-interacting protein [Actinotalea sp. M2MS4P-6]